MIRDLLATPALFALLGAAVARAPEKRRAEKLEAMEAWLDGFSPECYLPMFRLAESLDQKFLIRRSGFAKAAGYRRLQRELLGEYLRGLSRDYERLHMLSAASGEDAESSASFVLVDEKMQFILCMWNAEFRLLLSRLVNCRVDLGPLISNITELTVRTRATALRRFEYRLS